MQQDWFAQFQKQQQAWVDRQKKMHWDMLHRERVKKKVTLERKPDIRVLICHKCRKLLGFITLSPKIQTFSQSTRNVGIFTTCMECLRKGMPTQRIGKKRKATEEV